MSSPTSFCPRLLLRHRNHYSLPPTSHIAYFLLSEALESVRRVILRLNSSEPLEDSEVVDKFLMWSAYDKKDNDQHYTHLQPRQSRHFHIIIDLNFAQDPKPNLQQIPHELYRVSLKEGSSDNDDFLDRGELQAYIVHITLLMPEIISAF